MFQRQDLYFDDLYFDFRFKAVKTILNMFRGLFRNSTIFYIAGLACFSLCMVRLSILYKNCLNKSITTKFELEESAFIVKREVREIKLILLYTQFFGTHWNDYSPGTQRTPLLPGRATFNHCEFNQCEISYSKDLLPIADAVGFHGPDITTLPNRTKTEQIWFYFTMENPVNYNISHSLDGKFNWTMTYRRTSEIYSPYGNYRPRGKDKDSGEVDLGYKDMFVAWMVSNCRYQERNDYVFELMRYMQVDIYGYCGFFKCPFPRRSTSCRLLLQRYKFYLAFENGNCDEYITEKYWENAIENDVVPIIMGGGDDTRSLIPNSYINVKDFESPKELAEYLKYLNQNDIEYLKYFRWKRIYKLVPPKRACAMCAALHNKTLYSPPRVIRNMTELWATKDCRSLNLFNDTEDFFNSGLAAKMLVL